MFYGLIIHQISYSSKIDFATFDKITVRKTSDSRDFGQGIVAMDDVVSSNGTKLTLSNNGVKIGNGVSKVLISGNVFFDSGSKSYGWVGLRKNNVDTGFQAIASIANSSYGSAALTPTILEVTENDILTLYNRESNSNIRGGYATYMTVQVIG